jgi:hypothetical protein
MKSIINDERSIKNLKETIESLKKENKKLKLENKNISNLKEQITKLQDEKMELSRKIMEMESEAVLYKDEEGMKDEMLYNPRRGSRFSTISQKELMQKLQPNPSNKNINNKEEKKSNNDLNKITSTNFSILSTKNMNLLKDGLKNKNEEILLLKNELIKKEQIIAELKKNKHLENNNSITDSKLSLNDKQTFNSINTYNFIKPDEPYNKRVKNKPENYLDLLGRRFSVKRTTESKEINDSVFEESESHMILEKNIFSEIQNILEEKRNFILQTLTCENFSFDILNTKKNNETIVGDISSANIEQILNLIRQRKKKVEMTKKYLEEKMI